jgi:hypothetical protein
MYDRLLIRIEFSYITEGRSIQDIIMHAHKLFFIHVLFVVVYWLAFDLPVHDVDLRV